jgi:hypothetical protein
VTTSRFFTDDIADYLDEGITELLGAHGIVHAHMTDKAKEAFRLIAHVGQEYGYSVAAMIKQQMLDQIDLVPEGQRDGYRLAIRTVAETKFGKQHFWSEETS